MDGGVLPRHPFDPGAPEISADVPLLTGSNLYEFVNGLDRPEAQAMQMDELHRLVSQEFGERGNEIIDAYRRDYPRATPFEQFDTPCEVRNDPESQGLKLIAESPQQRG